MRDSFPTKKPGDDISADHINKLSDSARVVSGMGPGSFVGKIGGASVGEAPFIQRILQVVGSKDSTTNLYTCSPQYYNPTITAWVTDTDTYDLDISAFKNETLSIGDVLVGYWDPQRGTFIGIESLGSGGGGGGVNLPCDLWRCLDPFGVNHASKCSWCPCSSDPWLINITNVPCLGQGRFFGGAALFFNDTESYASGECVWRSKATNNFVWELKVDNYGGATLLLIDTSSGMDVVIMQWRLETGIRPTFCCGCTNVFVALCPTTFPVPCPGSPSEICVSPATSKNCLPPTVSGDNCQDCRGASPFGWTIQNDLTSVCVAPTTLPCGATNYLSQIVLTHTNFVAQCCWSFDAVCGAGLGTITEYNVGLCLPHAIGGDGVNVKLSFDFSQTSISPDAKATYKIDFADWNCNGNNTLTLDSQSGGTGCNWPGTITLNPTSFLIDDNGNLITDSNGNPISCPLTPQCGVASCPRPCNQQLCGWRWAAVEDLWILDGQCECNSGGGPCHCNPPPNPGAFDNQFATSACF